jgi:hypothetical protein
MPIDPTAGGIAAKAIKAMVTGKLAREFAQA